MITYLRRYAGPAPSAPPEAGPLRTHGRAGPVRIHATDPGAAATATAGLLLARVESDLELLGEACSVDAARLDPVDVVLAAMPREAPAARDGNRIWIDVATASATRTAAGLYSCHLLATQLVGVLTEGRGWPAGSARAAALARVLAGAIYPGRRAPFALTGPAGATAAGDIDTEDDPAAVRAAVLFLDYLHYELEQSWQCIVAARPDPRDHPGFAAASQEADLSTDNPFPIVRETPAPALADALAHRRWWRIDAPVRHLRAENVFVPEVYEDIVATFRDRLAQGHLTRSLPGYDASAASVNIGNAGGLAVFLTREWHDLVAGLLGVDATGDVIATLHHHAPGSASGTIHNDLNPGWFPVHEPGEMCVHDPAVSNYRTGRSDSVETVERVRAIALLYYFDTPPDVRGGGTGFYRSARQRLDRPDVVVPPKNNSLVAFECTPFSYHSFLTNTHRERNCLAMWLHRDLAAVRAQWGDASIVRWS